MTLSLCAADRLEVALPDVILVGWPEEFGSGRTMAEMGCFPAISRFLCEEYSPIE